MLYNSYIGNHKLSAYFLQTKPGKENAGFNTGVYRQRDRKRKGTDMENVQIYQDIDSFPENAVLIDLREEDDYAAGHIPGARRIPLGSLREEIRRIARFNTPILLYCYTGKKSAQAAELLQSRGYENARNIGGIEAYAGELEPQLTIRELRAKKGLSQTALARMIGVRQPTVAAYESGKAYPGPAIREAIRRMLFVTIAPPDKDPAGESAQKTGRGRSKAGKAAPGKTKTIREIRKENGMTQAAFAKTLGVCAGSIAAYEEGRTRPGQKVVDRIREIYGAELSVPTSEKKTTAGKTGRKKDER